MNKRKIYTLMYKYFEVLTFHVDLRKQTFQIIEKLEHFDKAPYGFDADETLLNLKLARFFHKRVIPMQRYGYTKIMKATHSKNGLSLAFKGHGLSLSNHYWFKRSGEKLRYKDINFFENKWDDTFARAVIKEDYKALSHANLNVPDIVTSGWAIKGWLYDEKKGPRLYKIGINKDNLEEPLGEVLASSLAQRIFEKDEVLKYDLEEIYGRYASVSSPIIGTDEELSPLSTYLSKEMYDLYNPQKVDKSNRREFFIRLKNQGHLELYYFFIKLTCLKSLCFVNDLHFDNISIVKNMKNGEIKVAPLYDLGGSFGCGTHGKALLEKPSKSLLLLIYFIYSNLEPEWDYSWYDKEKLVGFEQEIRSVLSKSEFFTKNNLIDFVLEVYRQQKASLEEMANRNKE